MIGLTIQVCTSEDLDVLAGLNKQLIEDEQHDNTMTIEQLKTRMEDFINTDYKAYLFKENGEVKGYALINHRRDPLYLRQFFICRNSRAQGYGKKAFLKLIDLLGTHQLDVEVMYWNEKGYAFWRSLGFKERSVYLRLDTEG
ncbi:N-acetyltransferase family protein [Paenibacillus tarimensis]